MAVHLEMYDDQYHTSELLGIALSNGEKGYFAPADVSISIRGFLCVVRR